ncbi:MAG: Ada metal-binding domain-containing protein [Phycisphaerae bacterium]
MVADAAVASLPAPLHTFFTHHRAAFLVHVEGDAGGGTAPAHGLPPDAHYLMLDVAASGDTPDGAAAAAVFPHDAAAARRVFRARAVRSGGSLPWVVRDRFGALARGFRSSEPETILREAGVITRLASAAAMPMNTTAWRDTGVGDGEHTLRHRYQVGLVDRLGARLGYEVRVHPSRYRGASDPVEAVFSVMLKAHGDVATVVAVDRKLIAALELTDAEAFIAARDAYYDRFAAEAAGLLESELENAALLAADLIGGAWREAGAPPLRVADDASRAADRRAAAAAGGFVGSRHSGRFHVPTCPSAARIKPENLVRFRTAVDAVAAGRTPCKTCHPQDTRP